MPTRTQIAVVALVHDGRVLMAHRHPSRRHYPDAWSLVGGHVEPGERPEQAARRECLEELGVEVTGLTPVPMQVSDPGLDMRGFVATRWTGDPTNLAPEEHDELHWFRPSELTDVRLAHPETLPSLVDAIRSAVE